MSELKLYVLGERSPDPEEWDGSASWALVLAHDPDEAARLAPEASGPPLEVLANKARLILFRSGDGGWSD